MEVITQNIEEESLVRRRGHLRKSSTSSSSSSSNGEETIMQTNGENHELIKPFIHQNEGIGSGQPAQENYIQAADLSAALQNVDIQSVISAVANDENVKTLHEKFLSGGFNVNVFTGKSQAVEDSTSSHSKGITKQENEHIKFDIEGEEEEEEEEIVELEFEKDVLHTHNIYCPNCSSKITKVILRRKVKKRVPAPTTTREGLFGCVSCFSVFLPIGNMLKPFSPWHDAEEHPHLASEKGSGFNCFGMFGRGDDSSKKPQPGDNPIPPNRDIILPIKNEPIVRPGNWGPGPSRISEKPDIIKSIVFGGLTESITSLSVVSSAAASHASTLNIVALGFANLIGGLFVLGQSLLDLKNDQQVDRYQELLGRKKHFLLHATLAILSYLVFGLVPPVVYGFTFRETDDRDYKLLAVAAASFICIVLLAIGKAYIQGPAHKLTTYLKTVTYYISTATLASGVGFAVGDLVNNFMEQLGWFKPNQAAGTLLFNGSKSLNPAFASY